MVTREQTINRTPVWLESQYLHTSHGMFTRKSGVSPKPFSSLNLSYGVDDTIEHVRKNRQRVKQAMHLNILVTSQQIHSDRVCCVDGITEDTEVTGYDALITDSPGTGLLIQQADCQAILLYDPLKKAIGAIHCGWKGSALNIIRTTVDRMILEYGSDPASLQAVISPSMGPCCAEFTNYRMELPKHFHDYQVKPNYFDFWSISRDQLLETGLPEKSIDVVSTCTVCNRDYFSYRRSKKQGSRTTGRHGSVICLGP